MVANTSIPLLIPQGHSINFLNVELSISTLSYLLLLANPSTCSVVIGGHHNDCTECLVSFTSGENDIVGVG